MPAIVDAAGGNLAQAALSAGMVDSSAPSRVQEHVGSARLLSAGGTIDSQVRRMLADPRAARTREDYYGAWLKLGALATATRDVPEFNPGLAALLTRSVLEGIHAVYREGAKVESLLGT